MLPKKSETVKRIRKKENPTKRRRKRIKRYVIPPVPPWPIKRRRSTRWPSGARATNKTAEGNEENLRGPRQTLNVRLLVIYMALGVEGNHQSGSLLGPNPGLNSRVGLLQVWVGSKLRLRTSHEVITGHDNISSGRVVKSETSYMWSENFFFPLKNPMTNT